MARTPRQCSFCGKQEASFGHLVAGPKVAICDECARLAVEIQTSESGPKGTVLLTGIAELVTCDPQVPGVAGVIAEAAVVIVDGLVRWSGPESSMPDRFRDLAHIDCQGRAVIPGFVDSHTHLVFAGERSREFARRLDGESYESITAAGGGIRSTVSATRSAGAGALFTEASQRAARMLAHGTTTVEVKSGYGLEIGTERRMLEIAGLLEERLPLTVIPTFLGAHAVPPEFEGDRSGYVAHVIEEMLPACAPIATYCDVFCEDGAFTVPEARAILGAATELGLRSRIHASQLGPSGGASLAAELGTVSADHLDHVTREEAAGLAATGTVAVLLPAASYSLRSGQAPGPMLWESGVAVALATDCNPGTSYVESMQLVVSLAVVEMGLTPAQAIWSATRGGALALEANDRGWIGRGATADLVVLDAPSYLHLAYRPGGNLVWKVLKEGTLAAG